MLETFVWIGYRRWTLAVLRVCRRRGRRPRGEALRLLLIELRILIEVLLELFGVLESIEGLLLVRGLDLLALVGWKYGDEAKTPTPVGAEREVRTGGDWLLNSSDAAELECEGVRGGMPIN